MKKKLTDFVDNNFDDVETFLSLVLLSIFAGYFITRLIWTSL